MNVIAVKLVPSDHLLDKQNYRSLPRLVIKLQNWVYEIDDKLKYHILPNKGICLNKRTLDFWNES